MSEQLEQLSFTCAACGKEFRWKPELAGRSVTCKCETVIRVPAEAGGIAQPKAGAAASVGTSPPKQGTPAQAVRKASSAPGIAGAARAGEVPPRAPSKSPASRQPGPAAAKAAKANAAQPPALKKKSEPAPDAGGDGGGDLDGLFELAADAEQAAVAEDAAPRCPYCQADLTAGAALCTACGTDLRTGKKLAVKSPAGTARGGAASPVMALAAGAPSSDPLPWGVRRRAPQDVGANRGFSTENVYFEGGRFRSLYLPLILIAVGLGLSMLNATLLAKQAGGGPVTASVVLVLTIGMIAIDGVLLFIALMLAVRLFDMGFGAVGPAMLKIVAIAMGPGAVGGIAAYFAGGGMNGFFVASIVSMILYYVLISVLFELDLGEVISLVTLIYLIENLAKPFILFALFMSAAGGVPGVSDEPGEGSGIGTSGYEILGDEEEPGVYEPPPDVYDHDGDGYYESTTPPPAPATTEPTTAPASLPATVGEGIGAGGVEDVGDTDDAEE
jgi:hypothetical protein